MEEKLMHFVQSPNRITSHTSQTHTHVIKLWEEIGEPSDYADELDIISFAEEGDSIVIDLCTQGGYISTATLFHRALKTTPAHTVAVIGPECSSAGSIIALSCSEFIIDTTSELMIHTSQYGAIGKDTDVYEQADFNRKSLKRLFDAVYKGFLSDEELSDVIKGLPLYFDADQLADRLDALGEYRESLAEKCDCEECSCEESQGLELDALIEESSSRVLDNILEKYDLVEKEKEEQFDLLEQRGFEGTVESFGEATLEEETEDGWIKWEANPDIDRMPVDEEVLVDVRFGNGVEYNGVQAGYCSWWIYEDDLDAEDYSNTIVAYRLAQ